MTSVVPVISSHPEEETKPKIKNSVHVSIRGDKIDRTFPNVLNDRISHQSWMQFCNNVDGALKIDSQVNFSRKPLYIALATIGFFFIVIQALFYIHIFHVAFGWNGRKIATRLPYFIFIYIFTLSVVLLTEILGSRGTHPVISNRKLIILAFGLTGIIAITIQVLFYAGTFWAYNNYFSPYSLSFYAFQRFPGIILLYIVFISFYRCCRRSRNESKEHENLFRVYNESKRLSSNVRLRFNQNNPYLIKIFVIDDATKIGCTPTDITVCSSRTAHTELEANGEFVSDEEDGRKGEFVNQ